MALPYDHISDSPHVQINFLCALLLARVLLGMKEDLPQYLDNFVVKLQGTGRCEQPYRENGWRVGVLARRKKINWWSRDATTVASMRVPHNYPQYMFTNLYMLMLCSTATFATVLEQCLRAFFPHLPGEGCWILR